jgi:hypothetical protein
VNIALQHPIPALSSHGTPISLISKEKVHTPQTQSWRGFAGDWKIARKVFSARWTM